MPVVILYYAMLFHSAEIDKKNTNLAGATHQKFNIKMLIDAHKSLLLIYTRISTNISGVR